MFRFLICMFLCGLWSSAAVSEDVVPRAHYIANMGALIEHGEIKVVFDPLFDYEHDHYDRVPPEFEAALLAGIEPFDSINAVFISHHHGDHFDPASILKLLRAQPAIEMFGPEQAAAAIRELVPDAGDTVLERIHGLSLENGETALDVELGSLLIEAVRVPHEGWPDYHENVENLVFRVTLDSKTTVMHFGDAQAQDAHYAKDPEHWKERQTHFAMPPFWFFLSEEGRHILQHRIGAGHAVGMHVPARMPDDRANRPEDVQNVDLFTRPGETRTISVAE